MEQRLSLPTWNTLRSRVSCDHPECQKHAHTPNADVHKPCPCIDMLNLSTIRLETARDLAETVSMIMHVCGVPEEKAFAAIETNRYGLLNYDLFCHRPNKAPKKRLRKLDLCRDWSAKCKFTYDEITIGYAIMRKAFETFHREKPDVIDPVNPYMSWQECSYLDAAKRTAAEMARLKRYNCRQHCLLEQNIRKIYRKFFERKIEREDQPVGPNCNCCYCAKKRGYYIYGKPLPYAPKPKKSKKVVKKRVCVCKKAKDEAPEICSFTCDRTSIFCICKGKPCDKFEVCDAPYPKCDRENIFCICNDLERMEEPPCDHMYPHCDRNSIFCICQYYDEPCDSDSAKCDPDNIFCICQPGRKRTASTTSSTMAGEGSGEMGPNELMARAFSKDSDNVEEDTGDRPHPAGDSGVDHEPGSTAQPQETEVEEAEKDGAGDEGAHEGEGDE